MRQVLWQPDLRRKLHSQLWQFMQRVLRKSIVIAHVCNSDIMIPRAA